MTHTPGPWMVEPINDGLTYQVTTTEDEGFRVLMETPQGEDQDKANACIAALAPQMLGFIEAAMPVLRAYLEGYLNGGCKNGSDGKPDRATLDPDFEPLTTACEAALFSGTQIFLDLEDQLA